MPTEEEIIAATSSPGTVISLTADFVALGLEQSDVVVVHSSLSALGWVAGGAQAVIEALFMAVGTSGTIVMPTQTGHLTDPANWSQPPVPAEWFPSIRDHTPAFDPNITPPRQMGKIVESFLQHPDTVRSDHPAVSFAARGSQAEEVVASHPLVPELGLTSPVGWLYQNQAKVLLLGVNHGNNTSLHLAEYRATWPSKATRQTGAPMLVDGIRQWVSYEDININDDDFEIIGDAFAETGAESVGPVGIGTGRLCNQREVVDFATDWMNLNRR